MDLRHRLSPFAAAQAGEPRALWIEAALIALLALVLNLAGNGQTSLWDRDEPRYAGCTREMRQSGDLIHPTFNAEPRYHKPVLIYWLMLATTAVAGDNPFGARLVSSLAGTVSVLLVWTLGRRMFGASIGRLAASILATAPLMVAESKLATTDATLMAFLTACWLALWELSQRASKRWAATFWVCLALATLTKGPVGPALIACSLVVSTLWGGPRGWWRRMHWGPGLVGFTLIAAPWYIAIAVVSQGEFYREAMGKHVLQRMTSGLETHGGFPGYYVVGTLLGLYPWSVLLPAGLLAAWVKRSSQPALGFLAGWIVGPLLLLEVVRTKLVHYYLPAFGGCALMAAWVLTSVAASELRLRRWPLGRLALGLLLGIGLGAAGAMLALGVLTRGAALVPFGLMALTVATGTIVAFRQLHAGSTMPASRVLVGTWALTMLVLGGWALPAVEPHRLSPRVAQRLRAIQEAEGVAPLMVGFQPPAVVYHFGAPIPVLQTRDWLAEQLRQQGPMVAALTGPELDLLRKDQGWDLDVREPLSGFDVERGRVVELQLVVIRPNPALASRPRVDGRY